MADDTAPLSDQEAKAAIAAGESKPWLDMLKDAEKAFQFYQDKCDNIDNLYASLERQAAPTRDREFAMFWANMQVLGPSIYSRPPNPVCVPRYNIRKPLPTVASEILERATAYVFHAEEIDATMRLVRDDVNASARGVIWVRDDDDELKLCIEHVDRKDFLHEPARNWYEVGWVARRAWLSLDAMRKRFPKKDADGNYLVDLAHFEINKDAKKDKATDDTKKAGVWELWHKTHNTVVWVTEGVDDVLDQSAPYFNLDGFFPCPKPAYATVQRRSLVPVPDFMFYKDQLEEINELTARIGSLSEALKVRGFYPAGAGEIGDAIEAAVNSVDNRKILVPVSNFAAFGGGSAKDMIVWLPIDMVATTITQCVELRKQLVEDVYEITGLSDIMRGQTEASETLGAQQLKTQFGQVRIRDKQSELVRIARDVAKIVGEIVAEHYDGKFLLEVSQMDVPSDADLKKQADGLNQQIAQITAQVQQAQQDPQVQQMARQAPDKAHQVLQQAQNQVQSLQQQIEKLKGQPTIEAVMKLLRDQGTRPFVLDIETDSTIQPDEDAEKQRRAEFLTALGGTLQQLAPMVQANPKTAGFAGEVLKFALAPFRAGRELEQSIDEFVETMQQMPVNQQPNADAMSAQVDQQRVQIEGQRLQFEQQQAVSEAQLAQQTAQREFDIKHAQIVADTELEWKRAQLQALTQIEVARISAKTDTDSDQLSAELEAALQMSEQEHEKRMAGIQIAADQQAQASDQAQMNGQPNGAVVAAKARKPSRDEQMNQVLASIADAMKTMAAAHTAPKRVVRGPDGRVSHVETIQ